MNRPLAPLALISCLLLLPTPVLAATSTGERVATSTKPQASQIPDLNKQNSDEIEEGLSPEKLRQQARAI